MKESAEKIKDLEEQLKEMNQNMENHQTFQNASQEEFTKLFEKKQATWKQKN